VKLVRDFVTASLVVFSIAPIGWLAVSSLRPVSSIASAPASVFRDPWTLNNYRHLLLDTEFVSGMKNSLIVALSVGVLAPTLALVGTFMGRRLSSKMRFASAVFWLSAYAVPAVVVVLPLFMAIHFMGSFNELFILVLGHLCLSFPLAYVVLSTRAITSIEDGLEEVLILDGADNLTVLRHAWIPSLGPTLGGLAMIAFTISMNDFVMARFLLSGRSATLPLVLQGLFDLSYKDWGLICAGGTLGIVAVTVPLLVVSSAWMRRESGGMRG